VAYWSEGWNIRAAQIRGCDRGILFKHGAGTGSMTHGFCEAKISVGTPSGQGIRIDTGVEVSRSLIEAIIWLNTTGQIGLYIDGTLTDSILHLTFEGLTSGQTPTGMSLGTNAYMDRNVLLGLRFIGYLGTKIDNPNNRPLRVSFFTDDYDRLRYNATDKMLQMAQGIGLTLFSDNYSTKMIELQGWSGNLLHKTGLRKAVASPTLGTGGTLGAAVDLSPTSGFNAVVPLQILIEVGGTLAAGESITVKITAVYSDGTTGSVSKSYTATGWYALDYWDIDSLTKDGCYITKFQAQAASSAASTSATVRVIVIGIQH
jgi:hypothetical protein